MSLSLVALVTIGLSLAADPQDEPVREPTLPVLVDYMPAAYPERALERAIEGDVLLSLVIDEEGLVAEVQVLEEAGNGFDGPAAESARTMRFTPALDEKGRPAAAQIQYRYLFRMDEVAPLSIDGVVKEKGSKKVLANALIKAVAEDDTTARTRSDDKGHFRFAALPPGKWSLVVSGPGLVTSSASVDVPADGYVEGVILNAEQIPDWVEYDVDEFVEVIAELQSDPAEISISKDVVVTLPGSFGDPIRALQNMPGVARSAFGSGQLQVRGTAPDDTQYLLDGVRIPQAFHFTGVTSVLAPDLLASSEILPGSWGARYGRAIGGIVNLESDDNLPKNAETSVSADLFHATGFTRQRLGQNTVLSLAARRSYLDTILQPVLSSNGAESVRVPRYYDAQLHFVQTTGQSGRFTSTLLLSEDRFRVLGTTGTDAVLYRTAFQKVYLRSIEPLRLGDTFLTRNWSVETALGVGPEVQELVLGADRGEVAQAVGLPLDLFSELPTDGMVREEALPRWSFRHEWLKEPGEDWLGLRAGVDWSWGRSALTYSIGQDLTLSTGVSTPALYGEPTLRLGPVDIIPGLRWEILDTKNAIMDGVLDPRLRIVATFGQTTLLGGLGMYSQPPAMREILATEGPSLTFERSRHASLGVTQKVGEEITLKATVYQQEIRGLISGRDDLFRFDKTVLVPGDSFYPFVNAGSGSAAGLELHGMWTTERHLVWLAATLSRAMRQDLPGETPHPSDSDQTINLILIGSREFGRWRFGGRARYTTGPVLTPVVGTIYSTDLQTWVPVYGEPYSDRAPAYFALDVRVDREFRFRKWQMKFYTELLNATNHRNVEIPSYNEDYSQLQPVTGLPILPVLGVQARW